MQPGSAEGAGGQVRVFVAVELPAAVHAALAQVQASLRAANLPLRLVPESVHLTLAFISEIPAPRVADLQAAVERGVVGIPVFSLRAEGLGLFPNARRSACSGSVCRATPPPALTCKRCIPRSWKRCTPPTSPPMRNSIRT